MRFNFTGRSATAAAHLIDLSALDALRERGWLEVDHTEHYLTAYIPPGAVAMCSRGERSLLDLLRGLEDSAAHVGDLDEPNRAAVTAAFSHALGFGYVPVEDVTA